MKSKLRYFKDSLPPLAPFDLEVPHLTIITGPNGSGKTRLLRAISICEAEYVLPHLDSHLESREIILVSDTANQSPFHGVDLKQVDIGSLGELTGGHVQQVTQSLKKLTDRLLQKIENVHAHPAPRVRSVLAEIHDALKRHYSGSGETVDPTFGGQISENYWLTLVADIDDARKKIEVGGYSIKDADLPQIVVGHKLSDVPQPLKLATKNLFSINAEQLMQTWAQRKSRNQYKQYLASKGKAKEGTITDEEFSLLYGPPPWDAIDKQLERLGLDVTVEVNKSAADDRDEQVGELLLKDSHGRIFRPDGLSSGERLLVLLALVRYIHTTDGIDFIKPKLVVFDEPDAHLHPSLVKELFVTIREVFLDDGIHVILTTHSPTTVALADEGGIVILEKYKPARLASRREALNLLLDGHEKAFVDISGSRLVFVEDSSDAELLERLLALLSHRVSSNIEFRSLSKQSANGTDGGGKENVRKVVNEIGSGRNIVGLIDFDGKEKDGSDIFVLCGDERYGIENLLLDPRIVVHMLLRSDSKKWAAEFDLSDAHTGDQHLNETELQSCIDHLHELVFQTPASGTREIEYLDDQKFAVGDEWLTTNGHKLRGKILRALPDIGPTPSKKDILQHIVDQVLLERPEMIPKSLLNTLNAIGNG